MPQSQKDHNGRYKVRFFLASHRLLMSRKFMSLFIQPSWAKSWAPGCLFAFQLLRQIGNTQNASEEVSHNPIKKGLIGVLNSGKSIAKYEIRCIILKETSLQGGRVSREG